jgi:two-component system, sporulation sensor kinase D
MNIYSKKQRWKLILSLCALLIGIASLWYTNHIVKKIAAEEREKVKLWADAIRKKAKLVKYTQDLFNKLKTEERKRMEMWADATKMLFVTENNLDRNFYLSIVNSNNTIPVILTDENHRIKTWRNIEGIESESLSGLNKQEKAHLHYRLLQMRKNQKPIEIPIFKEQKDYLYYSDSKIFTDIRLVLDDLIKSFISEIVVNSATVPVLYTNHNNEILAAGNLDSLLLKDSIKVQQLISEMEYQNKPIQIELEEGEKHFIFYKESFLLKQLRYYPYVQLLVFAIFLLIAYSLFSTARRSEQNQVWVGMAKETAHQLGTPLSSLIAWVELLKMRGVEEEVTSEIEKDLQRLETITERFSKIGSQPELQKSDLIKVLQNSISYLQLRVSDKVVIKLHSKESIVEVPLNIPLFEWVIENICKNAIDAMNGKGSITLDVTENSRNVTLDISDTGKGMSKANMKTVFQPGFTTKKRGWGLGLTLAKRIIDIYHSGKIFVKRTEVGKGTTFRIILPK